MGAGRRVVLRLLAAAPTRGPSGTRTLLVGLLGEVLLQLLELIASRAEVVHGVGEVLPRHDDRDGGLNLRDRSPRVGWACGGLRSRGNPVRLGERQGAG